MEDIIKEKEARIESMKILFLLIEVYKKLKEAE